MRSSRSAARIVTLVAAGAFLVGGAAAPALADGGRTLPDTVAPQSWHWELAGTGYPNEYLCTLAGQVMWPLFITECTQGSGGWGLWVWLP